MIVWKYRKKPRRAKHVVRCRWSFALALCFYTTSAFPLLPIALAFAFHVACPGLLVGRSWQRKLCRRVKRVPLHIASGLEGEGSGNIGTGEETHFPVVLEII